MLSGIMPPSELASPIERLGPEGGELDPRPWRFEPLGRLGAGATSEVWRARDRETGRQVALKIARSSGDAAWLVPEAERLACGLSAHLPELIALGRVPLGTVGLP